MESESSSNPFVERALKTVHRLARRGKGNSRRVSQLWKLTIKAAYALNSHPSIASLEKYWRRMKGSNAERDRVFGHGDNPLDIFGDYVSQGEYPPPEILAAVGWMINSYRFERGAKSLDEILTGSKHAKKNESHAFKSHKNLYFGVFAELLQKNPDLSQTSAAEKFLDEHGFLDNEVDVESFLRSYARWKNSKGV